MGTRQDDDTSAGEFFFEGAGDGRVVWQSGIDYGQAEGTLIGTNLRVHLPCIAGKEGLEASGRQGSDGDQSVARADSDDQGLTVLCLGQIATPLQQVVEFVFGIEECRHVAEFDDGDEGEDHRARQDYGPI